MRCIDPRGRLLKASRKAMQSGGGPHQPLGLRILFGGKRGAATLSLDVLEEGAEFRRQGFGDL